VNIKGFAAGAIIKQLTGYKSFIPNDINHTFTCQEPAINIALEKLL
jgi:hypothetical protein